MKKTHRISPFELKNLIDGLKNKFIEYEKVSSLNTWNSYLNSYDDLIESIHDITKDLGKPFILGSRPLRDILYYKRVDKSYHINTLNAIYLYIYGVDRKRFFCKERKEPKSNLTLSFIEENISIVNDMYEKGAVQSAHKLLLTLENNIDFPYLRRKAKILFAKYLKINSHIQMQLGIAVMGNQDVWSVIDKSIDVYNELGDLSEVLQALQLKGVMYRQFNDYESAMSYYRKAIAIAENIGAEKEKMLVMHDLAVSSFKYAEQYNKTDLINSSRYYFQKSSLFFEDIKHKRAITNIIRSAELEANMGFVGKANEILDHYEEASAFIELSISLQSKFLRINADRYLLQNDVENGTKYLNAAILFNRKEGFKHQLKILEEIIRKHITIVGRFIPDGFDLYHSNMLLELY